MVCMSCGLLPWRRARHRFLPAAEDLDDAHGSAATGTWFTQRERGNLWLRFLCARLFRGLDAEQRTAFGEVLFLLRFSDAGPGATVRQDARRTRVGKPPRTKARASW